MKLKAILACALVASPVFAQTDNRSETILAQERRFWTAYEGGDTGTLAKLLAPDFLNVEQNIWTRDEVLGFLTKFHSMCTLAPVKIEAPQVSFTAPDTAIVVYHATETPTCGTHTMSGDTNISTVWLFRNNQWQMRLHTEYAIPPK